MFDRTWAQSDTSSARTSWDDAGSKSGSNARMPKWVGNCDDYKLGEDCVENSEPMTAMPAPASSTVTGFGASIWTRVADAASSLTVSVSQALTDRFPASVGEVTPPGEESTLSRVLKAYHLDKADEPSDLPDWLFTAKERGMKAPARNDSGLLGDGDRSSMPFTSSRSSQDDYQTSSSSMSTSLRSFGDTNRPVTKAGDRLRALRDAKRSASMRTNPVGRVDPDLDQSDLLARNADSKYMAKRNDAPPLGRPPVKMGLPSRPGGGRRL